MHKCFSTGGFKHWTKRDTEQEAEREKETATQKKQKAEKERKQRRRGQRKKKEQDEEEPQICTLTVFWGCAPATPQTPPFMCAGPPAPPHTDI